MVSTRLKTYLFLLRLRKRDAISKLQIEKKNNLGDVPGVLDLSMNVLIASGGEPSADIVSGFKVAQDWYTAVNGESWEAKKNDTIHRA